VRQAAALRDFELAYDRRQVIAQQFTLWTVIGGDRSSLETPANLNRSEIG